jgi:glycosyltransferase involved in cell wall biosynthesis
MWTIDGAAMTSTPRRINLIAWDNKVGLSTDVNLLADALRAGGCNVHFSTLRRGKLRKWSRPLRQRVRYAWRRLRGKEDYDVNLMLEHVRPEDLPFARRNLLIPNPEWCLPKDVQLLPRIDGMLVKTHHAEPIFEALGCPRAFIGFTSIDRLDASVPRERAFFHLAGRSTNKGTATLLATWRRHPEWPRLTVLQSPHSRGEVVQAPNIDHRIDYVPDDELKRIQNAHRFHLCPSETEGFGHYLIEAMAIGALVVTLDAPPMNEMITPERGALIPYSRTGRQNLATTYFYDGAALETAVEHLLQASDAELERMGAAARAWFEDNDRMFRERMCASMAALACK